jgi:hypothetical protein
MLKDVRIDLSDKSHLHIMECELNYIPNAASPEFVEVTCSYFTIKLPYHSIEYIIPDWTKTLLKDY